MLPEVAAYLTSRDPLHVPLGRAYAYVLAGNGVWKLAENPLLYALIPAARCRMAGLPPLAVQVRPALKLPGELLARVLEDARRVARGGAREAMYHVAVAQEGGRFRVSVAKPTQVGTASRVRYECPVEGSRLAHTNPLWLPFCSLASGYKQ